MAFVQGATPMTPEREGALAPDDLVSFCRREGLAEQKWPERLELLDALPRNTSGKLQKLLLEGRFGGGEGEGA